MSLLLTVLVVQLVIHLVNTIGAGTINQLLWLLYTKLPTKTSKDAAEQVTLRREVVRLKREMNATSSQDEFAKWAKLRRQHDKALAKHDEKANAVKATKGSFDTVATVIRFLGTTGLRFILQFWFAKTPIYHLPKGWAPWAVEWVLAFPRAPKGTVSIQVWGSACAVVIALVSDAVSYVVVARQQKKASSAQKGQAQGVKVAAGGESEKTAAGEGKKEL